ncbi:MAG: tol-pal system YbgF family protein [Sandaracinaceae bacterium]
MSVGSVHRSVLALALATAAMSATHAVAQDQAATEDEGEARMHFRLGRAYYDSGRFAEAAREFETAYELSQRPALLHNMYVAYRDAGDVADAIRALREYLRRVPDAEEHEQLTARLEVMVRTASEQGVDVEASGTVERRPRDASASTGESASGSSAASSSSPSSGGTWTPGWIVLGVGAAAVIAGAITGGLALGERSRLDEMCDGARACDPGFEGTRDSAALLAGLTDGLLIGGGVIAAVGLVLALVITEDGGDEGQGASLACDPTGCMARGWVRF